MLDEPFRQRAFKPTSPNGSFPTVKIIKFGHHLCAAVKLSYEWNAKALLKHFPHFRL
jgi:hypothetical protein